MTSAFAFHRTRHGISCQATQTHTRNGHAVHNTEQRGGAAVEAGKGGFLTVRSVVHHVRMAGRARSPGPRAQVVLTHPRKPQALWELLLQMEMPLNSL